MNLEIDGTKKILLVEEGEGLSLVTESSQAVVSVSGSTLPIKGDKGDSGAIGPPITIAIGNVTSIGTTASATISAPSNGVQTLSLNLPQGNTGSTGIIGVATANNNNLTPLTYDSDNRLLNFDLNNIGTTGINGSTGTRYAGVWIRSGIPGDGDGNWKKGDILLSNDGSYLIVNKDGSRTNWITIAPVATSSQSSNTLTLSSTNSVGTSFNAARLDHTHALDFSSFTTSGVNVSSTNKIVDAKSSASTNPISSANKVIDSQYAFTSGDLTGNVLNPSIKPTNNVDFNQKQLNNLPTTSYPNNDGDAATKKYVDQQAVGLNKKDAVQAATTSNISSFPPSGTQTIDTILVTPTSGPNNTPARVLVKDQTDKSQNGIWIVGTPWTRATDMDGNNPPTITNGTYWTEIINAYVLVLQGSVNVGSSWVSDAAPGSSGTVGTTSITFKQFSAPVAIQAGPGIDVSGLTVSARADTTSNASIVVNSGASPKGIAVKFDSNSANSGLITDSSGLKISNIQAGMIASGTITSAQINLSDVRGSNGLNLGNVSYGSTFKTAQSFVIQGNIVASKDFQVPIIFVPTGFTAVSEKTPATKLVKIMYKIGGGSETTPSATFELRTASFSNTSSPSTWSAITGFSGLIATTTPTPTTSTSVTVNDNDQIALWITGLSGGPQHLSATLVFEHTIS